MTSTTTPPATATPSDDDEQEPGLESLIIPITSSTTSKDLCIEIFPEELSHTSISVLKQVLRDEQAPGSLWADAASLYMQQKQARDALQLLQDAIALVDDKATDNKPLRVRLLAATGIAHLAVASSSQINNKRNDATDTNEDVVQADQRFTQAGKLDTFFPMTWMGRGMLNLESGKLEQAKFFFQTTLKQCGPVLPALLGLAAVLFGQGDYAAAQEQYATALRRHPGYAATRVGFGLACYKLGQVDRAKAAFRRALALDPENVQAMVGSALLDMASAGGGAEITERAIKVLTMANLLDHSNAMVQNHLANHYFWKWTSVPGTVQVTQGSTKIRASQPIPMEGGEPIRIGTSFEATVKDTMDDEDEEDDDEDTFTFRMTKPWKGESMDGLKVWKKDYERVFALAKGAYNSTRVKAIQAESLFLLARVYHAREDLDNAHKIYLRASQLAPDLTPARFGLAQTLIVKGELQEAQKQLEKLLTTSQATDALALLGLLQVKSGRQLEEGLVNLRKAIDLDPINPELVILEAIALRQHKSSYTKSLEKYKKAVDLTKRSSDAGAVSPDIYNNMGVLCQETKKFDEALDYYRQALFALDESGKARLGSLENKGVDGGTIDNQDNDMFFDFCALETPVQVKALDGEEKKAFVEIVSPASTDADSLGFKIGELIRIGDAFTGRVVSFVEGMDGKLQVELTDVFDPPSDENEGDKEKLVFSLQVKRENLLLEIPEATTTAFNIARLHEVTGRTEAAIELHKSLIKRNPAYVNSYLRLACIAVDSGALTECAEWLKIGARASPGNSEVLTLIGNLHLSLCDWKPAQDVFEGLIGKKVEDVEAYSSLSLGSIYFETMHISQTRYAKHLQYASDYYKRILAKDPLNAYAANGLGTVLGERGEIFKAKEVFNRVREVSEDGIADALLNLGHIYLAQKKHPEALQMYQNYMKRASDVSTPTTSKSRADDLVDVLLYIAFAYFDWARHTELFNDANAAPADGRYKKALEHLEMALKQGTKKEIILRYNLCMTKLQAANCVLQKLTRNIPRTVEEVADALKGLEESLVVVEEILKEKEKGGKVLIKKSTLEDFLKHCRANIASAQSHLEDEKKRAEEEAAEREIRRLAAEAATNEEKIKNILKREEEQKLQEERDRKAEEKMKQVEALREGWAQEQAAQQAQKERKGQKNAVDSEVVGEMEVDEEPAQSGHGLFDDSDDDDDEPEASSQPDGKPEAQVVDKAQPSQSDLFGDSDDEDGADAVNPTEEKNEGKSSDAEKSDDDIKDSAPSEGTKPANKDLFGDSDEDEESDEELIRPEGKRENAAEDDEQPKKKRRVLEDDD